MSDVSNSQAILSPEDTPIGVAVRVGTLEKTQAEWFPKIDKKLDDISRNSASKEDIKRVEREIKDVTFVLDKKVDKTDFEKHKKDESKNRWVQNTLSAVFGVLLALLVTYIFNDIFRR